MPRPRPPTPRALRAALTLLLALEASRDLAAAAETAPAIPAPVPPAAAALARPPPALDQPASRGEGTEAMKRHWAQVERLRSGASDVLFLGDSITAGWDHVPEWKSRFVPLGAVNCGVGGDGTQHVIWRLDHGILEHARPRVVVLLIGTNNSYLPPEPILAGVQAILARLQARWPDAVVLLQAVFPRGPRKNRDGSFDDGVSRMRTIAALNAALPALADGDRVRWLDFNSLFLSEDGRIPETLMPDQLHLSAEGYRRWAEALEPHVRQALERPRGPADSAARPDKSEISDQMRQSS